MTEVIYATKSIQGGRGGRGGRVISISYDHTISVDYSGEAKQIFDALHDSLPGLTYKHLLALMLAENKRAHYLEALRAGELVEL